MVVQYIDSGRLWLFYRLITTKRRRWSGTSAGVAVAILLMVVAPKSIRASEVKILWP